MALSILVGLFLATLYWRYAPAFDEDRQATDDILPGLCEASTMVPWRGGYLIGDNETEGHLFAFYASLAHGEPLPLGVMVEDIEALATMPQGLLVVASQGANKKGKQRPLREQVLLLGASPVRPDLTLCELCEERRPLPPKEGGLSTEGAAWWRGALWFGLRSPLVDGRAILLRMEGDPSVELRAVEMVTVDLEGQGVRELVPEGDALLILAGPSGKATGRHPLFRLEAPTSVAEPLALDLPSSAEGFVKLDDGRVLYVTDGDGEPGEPCRVPATWGTVEFDDGTSN